MSTERLVLPVTPEGKLAGYAMEQLTLRHLDEWDENDGWTVVTSRPVEDAHAFTPVERPLEFFHRLRADADGHLYAYMTASSHTCMSLYRVRFDAGPVVGTESLRQGDSLAEHAGLVSGMVCYHGSSKWLHYVYATPDGGWAVSPFPDDGHKRYAILRYTANLHCLLVHPRDAYYLK